MLGSELNCTLGKGVGGERNSSRALLSKRLELARFLFTWMA